MRIIANNFKKNHNLFEYFSGAEKLRAAERQAKEKRLRLWKDYQSNAQNFTGKEKDFTGTVIEIYNGDAISVKTTSGATKKVFFSSIRPPREAGRYVSPLSLTLVSISE